MSRITATDFGRNSTFSDGNLRLGIKRLKNPQKYGKIELVIDMKKDAKKITQCETCAYFDYDYELDCDVCTINLDEDEVSSFYGSGHNSCPYYSFYDEYKIVRKQN